jgi:serine/threonine protein kinase
MEYCDGGNILTIQMKKGSMKLPYKEALNFMYQITLAVDYMHER